MCFQPGWYSLLLSTSDWFNSTSSFQGTGRYAIYIANYASGNVGPHALIEMDESASDLSQGVIALSNVAEQAGVNKFTGWCDELESVMDEQQVDMQEVSSAGVGIRQVCTEEKERVSDEREIKKEEVTRVKRQADRRRIFF